jgi:hypothetical protein
MNIGFFGRAFAVSGMMAVVVAGTLLAGTYSVIAAQVTGTYVFLLDVTQSRSMPAECRNTYGRSERNIGDCHGVVLNVARSGSSYVGRVTGAPSWAPSAYRGRGSGWIAFNVKPVMSGPATCTAGSSLGTLLYGSVFNKQSGVSSAGYVLVTQGGGERQLYFMPNVTKPVLANGQCNNRATYGSDVFYWFPQLG